MRYLVPIAATDDLFPRAEYHFPKPLIEINNVPMIELAIRSIRKDDLDAEFIFIVNRNDCTEFSLDATLALSAGPRAKIVQLSNKTRGALCSCLMAIEHINDGGPLTIVNGDQFIDANLLAILRRFKNRGAAAGVVAFESVHPRWSYIRTDARGNVTESAEKRVISRKAIAGVYYFRTGAAFVGAAEKAILDGHSVDGKFYISSTLNQVILAGGNVCYQEIPADAYHSFYSPQRIEYYRSTKPMINETRAMTTSIQVAIPMAGLGSRFSAAGYAKPKPFIDVAGKTMIERVMDNLRMDNSLFVLISRREHLEAEPDVKKEIEALGDVEFFPIDFVTDGAACTVLTCRARLNPDAPLLVANCDQIVDFELSDFIDDATERGLDGSILVFRDHEMNPKWSFARLGDNGLVNEVREKVAISELATVGLYYFRRASDFINGGIDMISRKDYVNGEYYVCPIYNYLIADGKKIGVYEIDFSAMHGTGTPQDLDRYLEHIGERT